MKSIQTMFYIFCVLFSFLINNTLYANDDVNTDIKVIGYTEKGNQWLLSITNKYINTNDPKIFTKEIVTSLKPLVCKNCNNTDHVIFCQKNRNLLEGEEVNCKDKDANYKEDMYTNGKIRCFGKVCSLKINTVILALGTKHNDILYEMGDAMFNLANNLIVNKEEKKNEDDVINSNNTSEEVSNDNTSKLEKAKVSCLKLGLEVKTEKFADCVLRFY
jgi:hypothetical protein